MGMSFSSVATTGKKILILQSPKATVAINLTAELEDGPVAVEVERTCFSDDYEAWKPFWLHFQRAIRARGYRLTTS